MGTIMKFMKILKITNSIILVTIILSSLTSCNVLSEDYILRGDKHYREGEYDLAIEAYEKAIASGYAALGAFSNLGLIYHYEKNDYEKAENIYKRGLSFYPGEYGLLLGLMNLHLDMGRLEEALLEYEHLAQIKGKKSLGIDADKVEELMLMEGASREEIANIYRKIITINARDLMSNFNLGMYYLDNKQYHEALSIYKKVLAINPEFKEVYAQIASAYSAIGDYTNAKLYFEKAKEHGVNIPKEFFEDLDKKISEIHSPSQ